MMMGDEDVAHAVERHARLDQLSRDAIAAINNIGNLVDEQERGGIAAAGSGGERRSALGAQQNDASRVLLRAENSRTEPGAGGNYCCPRQELSASLCKINSIHW